MIESINVLAELERIGIPYGWASESEVSVKCPFHEDESPSCFVNIEKRAFKCQAAGCLRGGDFLSLLAGFLKTTRGIVWKELEPRYNLSHEKPIDMAVIERWHAKIWDAGPLLKALRDRGVHDAMIRKYRLGENEGRITIPIPNENKLIVNVRKYLPGAPGNEKMRNMKGHSKLRIFPEEQLKYNTIIICGGEIKAIVAADVLNQHGIGAIAVTGGEGRWAPEFSQKLTGKEKVFVCMDIDEAGRDAADIVCKMIYFSVPWIGNVKLPLDIDKYPKGDINDFVVQEHGDLFAVLEATEQFVRASKINVVENSPHVLDLSEAVHARNAGERVQIKAVISAVHETPFPIPKEVEYICDKAQDECALCDLFSMKETLIQLHPESSAILEMVAASNLKQRGALMRGFGVPATCSSVQFEAKTFYNVEETRISPRLEITNRSVDRTMQPALCIGDRLELNESYVMTGRMHPHPATQQATLMISSYEAMTDALSSYTCESIEKLRVFSPKEWTLESLNEQIDDIYSDFEINVTEVYHRHLIAQFVDFAYYSPLLIKFDGRVTKGWAEVLIAGDSSCGKSETTTRLMQHYGLGEMIECKNATVAGLLGGLQQLGTRWFVTWGIIPTHDKRLVILDEVKGANTEVIAKLTSMRSSGIAEIPKIEKRRTHARTRLIWLSNPRSERDVATYNYGVEVIRELIGSPEDVRRFDAALVVARNDVEVSLLNMLKADRPVREHKFTSDLCHELILWTWTREPEQIIFDPKVTRLTLESANELCGEYDDNIPIVDRGSMRYKLARLASSLACRTFSTDDSDPNTVIVRECHVQKVKEILKETYNSTAFGYNAFSQARSITSNIPAPNDVHKRIKELPFPEDFARHILAASSIDPQDIQDWSGWGRQDSSDLMSFLVRKNALRRSGRLYYKSPPFITILKTILENGHIKTKAAQMPEKREF